MEVGYRGQWVQDTGCGGRIASVELYAGVDPGILEEGGVRVPESRPAGISKLTSKKNPPGVGRPLGQSSQGRFDGLNLSYQFPTFQDIHYNGNRSPADRRL